MLKRAVPAFAICLVLFGSSTSRAQQILHIPSDVGDLQTAISQVADGGVIEMAPGTYTAPSGAWHIFNNTKSFTVRAAPGAAVTLSGGGAHDILRFQNNSNAKPVIFEGLTFANGFTTTAGLAAAVTLGRAQATFIDVAFVSNTSNTSTNGGAGLVAELGSKAFFDRCTWTGNRATYGGAGMLAMEASEIYIHESEFIDNRTNISGAATNSFGGAIALVGGVLRVTNTRFDSNGAGYAGGAIFAMGSWADPVTTPVSDVLIANSTFTNNQSAPAAGITPPTAPEGGAIHAEDQTTLKIYNTRFLNNTARAGGAISCYRCIVEAYHSLFRGNTATGKGGGEGNGGTIFAHSDDSNDPSTNNGAINRRSASLTVTDSLFQGDPAGTTSEGRIGGCIFLAGDGSRAYGLGGVKAMGGVAGNLSPGLLDHVAFANCDVVGDPTQSGTGGALAASLASLSIHDVLIIKSDATSTGGVTASGGGLALYNNTTASVDASVIAGNTALTYGGGIWVSGSHLDLTNSSIVENALTSGNLGSGLFSASDTGGGGAPAKDTSGTVTGCVISHNTGASAYQIMDGDISTGPINSIQYFDNQIYPNDNFSFLNGIAGARNVPGLDSLVVSRTNGTSTIKAPNHDNNGPGSLPQTGGLWAVPASRMPVGASGDAAGPTESDLVYGWSGVTQASLDGSSRSGFSGIEAASSSGSHALVVGTQSFGTNVWDGAAVHTALSASPSLISAGSASTLSWSTASGAFLDESVDHGAPLPATPSASGSVQVQPSSSTPYRGWLVAEEGGDVDQAIVDLNGANDLMLKNGFEGGNFASWSTSVTDNGNLSVTGTAALASTAKGMQAVVNDTNSMYVEDDTPAGESRYRARFYLDPNTFDPGESAGSHRARVFIAYDAQGQRTFTVSLKRQDGAYSILARVRKNDGTRVDTPVVAISNAPHAIEVHWRGRSSAQDGILDLWIDGNEVALLTGIANDGATVESVRLGAMSLKTGARGTLYFDEFESRRLEYISTLP